MRWCLVSLGLLGALLTINSGLLGVVALQPSTNLQLLPMQIIGQSNLKNLVLNLTVRNIGITDVTFRLGYSLRKVGEPIERPNGVEVGECFIADCTIKGRGTDNPAAPLVDKVDKVVQLILKINQNEILELNGTYQLSVFLLPYNIDSQGCGNRICVGQSFFKYDVPELHPIMLSMNPPSPSPEGGKIFVYTTIENTGAAIPDGYSLEISYRYCRQLSATPCDPDNDFRKPLVLDSSKVGALTPKFLGAASTINIPLDDRADSQVVLDADQLKLTGQIRIKVSIRLVPPANPQGTAVKEADESNNEIITPYRILSRTAITQFVVNSNSPALVVASGTPNKPPTITVPGAIIYFDRNTRKVCTYPKDAFASSDPRVPQQAAAYLNCEASFDLEEITDLLVRSSTTDVKICDLFLARPDGNISRAKCAVNRNLDKIYLIKPTAKETTLLENIPDIEPYDFVRDKFDSVVQRIVVDPGKRLNQLLLVERFNKLLVSTNRGKVWQVDVIKAEDFSPQAQGRPDQPVLDAGSDTSIDLMRFFGANVLVAVNSRVAEKGQFYLLRADAAGKFTAQPIKLGNAIGPNLETDGRIVTFEYDGEFKRLIVATTKSVTFYAFPDTNTNILQRDPALALCAVPATSEIRDMLYLTRGITTPTGKTSFVYTIALALGSKSRTDGEVQFLNVNPPSLPPLPKPNEKPADCKKAETPGGTPLTTLGAITKIVRAIDIPTSFRNIAPDQPIYILVTALDGRVYPFKVGVKDFDADKLIAQVVPNDENIATPFFPAQPIQETPSIESGGNLDRGKDNPLTGLPTIIIYYVSDAVYCRRYIPLEDSAQRQIGFCNESPSANSALQINGLKR